MNYAKQIQHLRQQRNRAAHYKPPVEGLSGIYRSGYEQNVNAARNTRDNALATANYQQAQLNNSYGFGQNPQVNPYSAAAQLQAQLQQANRSSVNSYAAQGQLYSGALTSNALGANTESYNKNYNALRSKYQDQLFKINQARAAAKSDFRSALPAAMNQAINDQLKAEPDATAAPYHHGVKWYSKKIHALKKKRRNG